MIQKPAQCFESDCKRAIIYVDNDMPIGVFHDFLMKMKGEMVERMMKIHKEEQEISNQQKKHEENEPLDKVV